MVSKVTKAEFAQLRAYNEAGNREAYYQLLTDFGDPYGDMALSVVRDEGLQGVFARDYAEKVATDNGLSQQKQSGREKFI